MPRFFRRIRHIPLYYFMSKNPPTNVALLEKFITDQFVKRWPAGYIYVSKFDSDTEQMLAKSQTQYLITLVKVYKHSERRRNTIWWNEMVDSVSLWAHPTKKRNSDLRWFIWGKQWKVRGKPLSFTAYKNKLRWDFLIICSTNQYMGKKSEGIEKYKLFVTE